MSSTRPASELPATPTVAAIVAARNASATIEACVRSLAAQNYPALQIIVADDGSDDDTAARAARAGARVIETESRGPSAARNVAVARHQTDIVAFTDSDCTVAPGWIEALLRGFRASGAASVGGRQQNVFNGGSAEDAIALEAFFRLAAAVAEYSRASDDPRDVPHNASCNSAYLRAAFLEVGGFSEDLWPGEDVDLDYRLGQLGYRCFYVPDALVHHHRPGDREWFRRMMRRYGQAQREIVTRHGRFRPIHYMPFATTALIAAQGLWLSRDTRPYVGILDGILGGLLVAALAGTVPLKRWPQVIDYAVLAVFEWNRGYVEGLPTSKLAIAKQA